MPLAFYPGSGPTLNRAISFLRRTKPKEQFGGHPRMNGILELKLVRKAAAPGKRLAIR